MFDYCYDSKNGIDDIANQFGMRMDLHLLGFDCGEFCIAVKNGRAFIHVLQVDPAVRNELIPLYHNSPFDTDGLSIPFIYSRFAWSIFYKGMIRLRYNQQFLIVANEGVSESVASYYLTRLEDSETKGQDDEGYEWNMSEDRQSEDEDDVCEEQPTNNMTASSSDNDEAAGK